VRSAAAIGQILACPKCGSMVQVAAPAGSSAGAAVAAVAASTAPVIAAAPIMPSAPPAVSTFDEVADLGVDLSAGTEELAAAIQSAGPPAFVAKTPTPPPAKVANAAPKAAAAKPPVASNPLVAAKAPTAVATAPPAASGWSGTKLAALIGGSAVVGSVLVVGALSMLGDDPQPTAPVANVPTVPVTPTPAEAGNAAPIAPDSSAAITPTPGTEPLPGVPAADVAAINPPEAAATVTDNDPFAPPPEAAAATNDAAAPNETVASNDAVPAPPAPDTAAAPPTEATAAAAPPDESTPRLRIDPLTFDPEGLDLTMLLSDSPPPSQGVQDLEAAAPAPAVDSAAQPEGVEAANDAAVAAANPGPVAAVLAEDQPAAPNVLLARKYPSVKIDGMPLGRFLNMATSLSALPVSVAPDELRLAAVSAATAVSVDAKDATIEQVLTAALKPLRLAPHVANGQIVLRRALADGPKTLAYPVDDLVDGDAAELARWVQTLVAPESWKAKGGAGELTVDGATLRINNTERVGYETILLLERYRLARGLAPRSKYPKALLEAGARLPELAERMAGPATFTFSRPTPVRDVFAWWQEELGVAVLVDWPALDTLRLPPHARLTASTAAQPWSAALDAVLTPLGLGWRAVDGRTIEITTHDKLQTEPVVELYRLNAMAPRDEAAVIAKATAAGFDEDAAFYDAAHRVLLVRAPASVQRALGEQFAQEQWLERN
jgi:hypothetical protein